MYNVALEPRVGSQVKHLTIKNATFDRPSLHSEDDVSLHLAAISHTAQHPLDSLTLEYCSFPNCYVLRSFVALNVKKICFWNCTGFYPDLPSGVVSFVSSDLPRNPKGGYETEPDWSAVYMSFKDDTVLPKSITEFVMKRMIRSFDVPKLHEGVTSLTVHGNFMLNGKLPSTLQYLCASGSTKKSPVIPPSLGNIPWRVRILRLENVDVSYDAFSATSQLRAVALHDMPEFFWANLAASRRRTVEELAAWFPNLREISYRGKHTIPHVVFPSVQYLITFDKKGRECVQRITVCKKKRSNPIGLVDNGKMKEEESRAEQNEHRKKMACLRPRDDSIGVAQHLSF